MSLYYKPEQYLTHFLRVNIADNARTDENNTSLPTRLTNSSESFDGNGTDKTFTVTNSVDCFTSVTVGGTTQTPYLNYDIDINNKQIVFKTAPPSGTDNVVINYKTGSHWIYFDKARDDLGKNAYPRITVLKLSHNASPQGVSEDDSIDNVTFQIDLLSYKDVKVSFSGESLEGQDVVDELTKNLITSIKRQWRDELAYVLFDPRIINSFNADFEPDRNIFRNIVEVSFQGFNLGE